ncbi:MAG: c-type cytochrome [Actinobacteria bacterium]|nr:c-type cytochrome [Actinomycetota bacterium]
MTEVPDHLLARSRARRAALGLGGEGGGEATPAAEAAGAEVEKAGPTAAAKPAAAAVPAEVAPKAPEPLAPYVEANVRRKKIPYWAMPVLAFFPVWGVLYAQTLSKPPATAASQLDAGAVLYANKCASCHGGAGGGGVGRQLSGGEVLKTFPNIEQQMEFVRLGDAGFDGKPYGDPSREGGARTGGGFGSARMPAFKDSLTQTELFEVVRYEREKLGGEKVDAKALPDGPDGKRAHANGKPYLTDAGVLVTSDGKELFDKDGKLTTPETVLGTEASSSG